MAQHEEMRIQVKKDRHLLLNVKRNARSPERLRTLDPTSPHNGFKSVKQEPDHIRLVGNKKSTGRFVSGKSVPRSRPTMFWEHQEKDLPFNYEEYLANREQRIQRHQEKMNMLQQKTIDAESEIVLLTDQNR